MNTYIFSESKCNLSIKLIKLIYLFIFIIGIHKAKKKPKNPKFKNWTKFNWDKGKH